MKIDNIIPSELKVVASENLDISQDLQAKDPDETLEQIINEKKEQKKSQD
jgi:hypothetical protein